MKTYKGVNILIHVFLALALVGDEWSASRPGEKPSLPIGLELGPRVGLDHLERRKTFPYRNSNSEPSIV
jgi:hypothetical protein